MGRVPWLWVFGTAAVTLIMAPKIHSWLPMIPAVGK